MIDYKIIASGSKGNAVIIRDILVDCGVPYKRLEKHLKCIKYIFITHIHSDHLNKATFKKIKQKWGHIKIFGNYELAQEVGLGELTKILSTEISYRIGDVIVQPFECVHDVETFGYTFQIDDINIIYATDTNNLNNAPKIKYDYFFIESNHDEKKLEMALRNNKYKYDVFGNAKRHLSTQQAKSFYFMNRKSKDSVLIELHKSERFY